MTDDLVRGVMEENADSVRDYLDGEAGAKNFLVGQSMAASGGRMDPAEAVEAIDRIIEEDTPEWPVTFSVHRRPVDGTNVLERMATILPNWVDRPGSEDVAKKHRSFEFEVTVFEDGLVDIEVVADD